MSAPSPVTLLRQRIHEALTKRDRSVLVVVGSGVSIQATGNAKAASWGGLLRLGIERCQQVAQGWRTRRFDAAGVQAQLASSRVTDWIGAATAIEKVLGAPDGAVYKDWLRETVGALTPTDPDVLHALGMLGVPLATTNYDGLLEYALGLQGMTWRTHGLVDQLLTGAYPGDAVLHLHGHFSEPQSIILGAASYAKILGDKRAQSTLRYLLQSRDLIFVGMGGGLDDPNFGALIEWANDVSLPESRYHFLLLRESEAPAWRARLVLTSRIHVLSYGQSYADLVPFLRGLVSAPSTPGITAPSTGIVAPAWVQDSIPQQLTMSRNLVRRAFFETLRTDSDADAFCLDHFPETYRQFSSGMDRQRKVNHLLERERPEEVFALLRTYQKQPTVSVVPPSSSVPSIQPATAQQTKQAVWRALLRLDRITQWKDLVASVSEPSHCNQLVLLSGCWDQNVSLFLRRIEEHLREHVPSSRVIEVPLKLSSEPAKTGARWGIHLHDVLGSKLGIKNLKPDALLTRATQDGPLVVVLIALPNPLQPISDLTTEQQTGLGEFLSKILPKLLKQSHRVTVLLPLEYRQESQSLLPWAREIALAKWNGFPLCHSELPKLTLPTWEEVEEYLRRYPERLPLDKLLPKVKTLYQELCQPGVTFDRLATEIDNLILLHG